MSDIEKYRDKDNEGYDQTNVDTERANQAEEMEVAKSQQHQFEISKASAPSFPQKDDAPTMSKCTQFCIALIIFSTGFLLSMMIFDDLNAMEAQAAFVSLHQEYDQSSFLSEMNKWPNVRMSKYMGDFPERYNMFKSMWESDKAGGEEGLFRKGRTIPNNLVDYITYEHEMHHEGYFKLYNLPIDDSGQFVDIWLFNSNVMAKSDRDTLEHITQRSQLQEITKSDIMKHYYDSFSTTMFYTQMDKLHFKDYSNVLNGYCRMISYTVAGGGDNPQADYKANSVHSIYEGRIQNGVPHGLGRQFTQDDEAVRIGNWNKGKADGKMIEYSKNFRKEGNFHTNPDGSHTIKFEKITTFLPLP